MQIIEELGEETEKHVAIAEIDNTSEVTSPSVDDLDSEAGFFQLFIRPMLKPGHEGELCEWLKEIGVLQRTMKCINSIDNDVCNTVMHWNQARNLDKYQWICLKCNSRRTIRDNTVFKEIKCSFATALRIILGWCKNIEMEDIAEILHTKMYIVKKVYEICTSLVSSYFQIHKNEFKFGGVNGLVIVDVFPGFDYDEEIGSYQHDNNNSQPILCIGEIKEIPTQFYFHVLNMYDTYAKEDIVNEAVIKMKEIVKAGTTIVINSKLAEEALIDLRECNKYSLIIGTEELAKYDTPIAKTLSENLDTIWQPAVSICEEAQRYGNNMNSFLIEQMWLLKFGMTSSTAFEYLMNNFNDCWENLFPDID